MIDYALFADRMATLCDIFNRKPLQERSLKEFWKTLSDVLTDEEFNLIYQSLLEESEFFPVPATFLKLSKKRSQDNALAIWERAKKWIVGGYLDSDRTKAMRNDLGKPVMKILADIGGISRILNATESEMLTLQKEFVRAYGDELIKINLQQAALPPS